MTLQCTTVPAAPCVRCRLAADVVSWRTSAILACIHFSLHAAERSALCPGALRPAARPAAHRWLGGSTRLVLPNRRQQALRPCGRTLFTADRGDPLVRTPPAAAVLALRHRLGQAATSRPGHPQQGGRA